MSCPIFSPSNPLLSPKTHPYLSKYLPKYVFFELSWGGGSLLPPIKAKLAKFPKKCQNALRWHIMNDPEIYSWLGAMGVCVVGSTGQIGYP